MKPLEEMKMQDVFEVVFTSNELYREDISRIEKERTKLNNLCSSLQDKGIEEQKSLINTYLENNYDDVCATLREVANRGFVQAVEALAKEKGIESPMSPKYEHNPLFKIGDEVSVVYLKEKMNWQTGKTENVPVEATGKILDVSTTKGLYFVCWYEKEGRTTFYKSAWKKFEEIEKKGEK